MIIPDVYSFLSEIRLNNNKEWFDTNRKRYEIIKQNVSHVAEIMIHEISQIDKSVSGLLPKNCTYRINRDIRFSTDKSPYKINGGIFVCPGGKSSGNAGYYLHIEPGNSFLSGGVYMPSSPILKAIREDIYHNYDEFLEIVTDKTFKSAFTLFWGDKLKTRPKGFPEDFAGMEYLKLKHFTVLKNVDDKLMMSSKLLDEMRKAYSALYPLNRFLNNAIKESGAI